MWEQLQQRCHGVIMQMLVKGDLLGMALVVRLEGGVTKRSATGEEAKA